MPGVARGELLVPEHEELQAQIDALSAQITTLQSELEEVSVSDVLNVKTLGAVGDGVVDDTAVIQGALDTAALTKQTVYFPVGTFKVTSMLTITAGVKVNGVGWGIDSGGTLDQPYAPASKIVSTTTQSVLKAVNLNGVEVSDLVLESSTAAIGLNLDQIVAGTFRNLYISCTAASATALIVAASSDTGNNTSYSHFDHLYLKAPKGLRVTGSPAPQRNVCHNQFFGITANANVANTVNEVPVYFENGDNNLFFNLRVFVKPTNTNYGTQFGPRFRSNTFIHLQEGATGLKVDTPELDVDHTNCVWAYTRSNGMAAPTLNAGANLTWFEASGDSGESFNFRQYRQTEHEIWSTGGNDGAIFRAKATDEVSAVHTVQFGMNAGASAEFRVIGSDPIVMLTNNTERLKIDSTGYLVLQQGPQVRTGTADPEGSVVAPVGSIYLRTTGGASTTLYIKTSGTGNTGWTAK